ncbi:hypothetical protein [Sphingomonas sp.]|jgi:hypothetical protein|uniref:hypothetical protein n=1 Tax=Sphingomonas sp. TaxID=28214 RepID=UPI002E35C6EA|nr:hypothetical protein [Sphingomonas sp.]HEX4695435.1 hypothetical protein [Sphingomonas sp.]
MNFAVASRGARSMVSVSAFALAACLPLPAGAQTAPDPAATPAPTPPATPADAPSSDQSVPAADAALPADAQPSMPRIDILSKNTISMLFDARLAVANGERSFTNRGLGKTRFEGTANGDYKVYAVPVEADLIWLPRFTPSLTANVSAAWQRDQENKFDLIEAFVNFLPPQTGKVGVQFRAGLMWPEISQEHSTGGAWSVVNTITPSVINSWVGEEVKVLGVEGTVRATLGQSELGLTGGIFAGNDTSGTLLSFRGWALHDEKATGFGHFPLPPLNPFIRLLQEDRTRSTIELDNRLGFYGRLEWRPPIPVGVALFYYDNRGNPQAFTPNGQWGWRTRFWNLGINADLGTNTRLLLQGMSGSTIMGFKTGGVPWVHTYFNAAYAMVTRRIGDKLAISGRVEAFNTREHGSEMSPLESEDGWSSTVAARYNLTDNLTLFGEALNVRSRRGVRANLGLHPFQAQTVFQLALRFRL